MLADVLATVGRDPGLRDSLEASALLLGPYRGGEYRFFQSDIFDMLGASAELEQVSLMPAALVPSSGEAPPRSRR
jgi:hypothetical protein